MFSLREFIDICPVVHDVRFEVAAVVPQSCQEVVLDALYCNASLLNESVLAGYFCSALDIILAGHELEMVGHLIIVCFNDAGKLQLRF